jgi:hypothetical protein
VKPVRAVKPATGMVHASIDGVSGEDEVTGELHGGLESLLVGRIADDDADDDSKKGAVNVFGAFVVHLPLSACLDHLHADDDDDETGLRRTKKQAAKRGTAAKGATTTAKTVRGGPVKQAKPSGGAGTERATAATSTGGARSNIDITDDDDLGPCDGSDDGDALGTRFCCARAVSRRALLNCERIPFCYILMFMQALGLLKVVLLLAAVRALMVHSALRVPCGFNSISRPRCLCVLLLSLYRRTPGASCRSQHQRI